MAKTSSPAPPRTVSPKLRCTEGKQDLDISVVWVRAMLHSTLGPDRGEQAFRQLPALQGLLMFRRAWERGMSLGEQ